MEEETFDHKGYFIAIRRHLFGIVLFTVLLSALAAYLLQFIPDVYKADVSIFIETKESNVVSIEGMYQIDMSENEYFNTQISILKSRSLAEQVFQQLQLIDHPFFEIKESKKKLFLNKLQASLPEYFKQFFPKPLENHISKNNNPQIKKQYIINQLLENIKVSQIDKSKIISLSYETSAKDLVANITNAFANLYIKGGMSVKSKDNQHALTQLSERVANLKETLLNSENKLNEYKNNNNLLDLGGIKTLEAQNIEIITRELLSARKRRTDIEIIYSQIKEIKNPSIENYESIPWLMENKSIQDARQNASNAQSLMIELNKLYGIKHPKIQSALSQYKKARINYAQLLKAVTAGIKNKYRAAVLNERILKGDLNKIKKDIQNKNNKNYQLRLIEKEVESNRKLFEIFSKRFKEANQTIKIDSVNATIVDSAVEPNEPISPKRTLITLMVCFFGLSFAIIIAFVSESLVKTFRFPDDVKYFLDTPFLGILPKLIVKSKAKNQVWLPYLEDRRSLYAESIRTIRTGIMLSLMNLDKKIVIITSSVPNEGKTTVSLNLAIAMGKTQKVLLVDTDMRKSSVAKQCGIQSNTGLSSLITKQSEFDTTIHHFEDWNIDILPAGDVTNNPQELLCSANFAHVLEDLSKQYDFILLDSAPIAPVADTLLISKIIKNIIFVVKSESTTKAMALSSIERLNAIDVNLLGVVLNELDVKKASKYRTDDYYSGYYDDYGYNS
ncbi:MAG: polysaccharide biosynthesis tyrosine autokinase [Pseudomonadota bacterium]